MCGFNRSLKSMYFCFHIFFRNLCGVECPTERPPEITGLCCVYCILHLPSLSESDIELLSESSLSESVAVDSEEWGWSGVGVFMDLMISACCFIRQGYILTNLINMSVKLFSTVSIVFFPVDFKSARYHSRFCIFN